MARLALVEIRIVYTEFFGLNDKPFSISPDPRYLYLSQRHADALAHLIYGISESGGFIQLTGEVGTGKTTLIRSLLEQLPEKAEIALILNPQLTTKEFLEAICEELRIDIPRTNSVKAIVDRLNEQLLLAHSEDRRIVLIVDEAQTLSPELLEQVRLLTNLETAKKKLLQIILIGQPELRELLERPEMRQIAQRVTGRYHLEPLTYDDTALYVEHRMKVAGALRPVFTRAAVRQLYRSSRGIPRLINVVADRALLAAYTQDKTRVDGKLVQSAAAEVFGRRTRGPWWPWVTAAAGLAALALASLLLPPQVDPGAPGIEAMGRATLEPTDARFASDVTAAAERPVTAPRAGSHAPVEAVAPEDVSAAGADAVTSPAASTRNQAPDEQPAHDRLAALLADGDTRMSTAVAVLFSLWNADYVPGPVPACEQASRVGLSCLFVAGGSIGQLRSLNKPVLLTLHDDTGAEHNVIMTGLDYDSADIAIGERSHSVSVVDLTHRWYGEHLLLWRPAVAQRGDLTPGSVDDAVTWLRDSLARIRGVPNPAPDSRVYDAALEAWVREYQRDRRLIVDGIVGARTQIAITSELEAENEPSLYRAN